MRDNNFSTTELDTYCMMQRNNVDDMGRDLNKF